MRSRAEVEAQAAKLIERHGEELARMIDATTFAILDMHLAAPVAPKPVVVTPAAPVWPSVDFDAPVTRDDLSPSLRYVGRTTVGAESLATYHGVWS